MDCEYFTFGKKSVRYKYVVDASNHRVFITKSYCSTYRKYLTDMLKFTSHFTESEINSIESLTNKEFYSKISHSYFALPIETKFADFRKYTF